MPGRVIADALTGVQALECKHPNLPPAPGKIERREFAYIRCGTRALIVNRDVVTGQVVAPSCSPTRIEADFVAHGERTVATDPVAARWHFVVDNLKLHQSAAWCASSRRPLAFVRIWASRARRASSPHDRAAPRS